MKQLPGRLILALLVLAVPAAGFPVSVEAAEVRLYTNDDLDRFPKQPDSTVRAASLDPDEWAGVVEYLEREHSRIDADRAYELERNQSEAEVELIQREAGRQRYSLPFGAWGFGRIGRHGGGRPGHGKSARILATSFGNGGAIRPLHAGPTRAQVDYFKATRRSGADAFPQRSRPRVGPGQSK